MMDLVSRGFDRRSNVLTPSAATSAGSNNEMIPRAVYAVFILGEVSYEESIIFSLAQERKPSWEWIL